MQHEFYWFLKRAAVIQKETGKRIFVDFRAKAHTFEINPSGEPHLLTPKAPVPIDPRVSRAV